MGTVDKIIELWRWRWLTIGTPASPLEGQEEP